MRAKVFCTILTLVPVFAFAQQSASPVAPPSPKLFAGSADVVAMMAKAKAERKPDQANFVQPIVQLAPYNANLEYRAAGVNAPASVHEREAEMFYVVDGSGTLVTGGKLREEKRTNAENLTGTGIDGGMSTDFWTVCSNMKSTSALALAELLIRSAGRRPDRSEPRAAPEDNPRVSR